jgi:hypothetical protein
VCRLLRREQNDIPIGLISDTDLFRIVDEFGWEPL